LPGPVARLRATPRLGQHRPPQRHTRPHRQPTHPRPVTLRPRRVHVAHQHRRTPRASRTTSRLHPRRHQESRPQKRPRRRPHPHHPPTKRQPHDRPLRPLPVPRLPHLPAPRRHRPTTKGGLSIGAHPDDQTELLHLAHDRRPHTHPAPHLHRPLDPRRRRRALHLRPPPHPRRTLAPRRPHQRRHRRRRASTH